MFVSLAVGVSVSACYARARTPSGNWLSHVL